MVPVHPTIRLYSEPDQFRPHLKILIFKVHFNTHKVHINTLQWMHASV